MACRHLALIRSLWSTAWFLFGYALLADRARLFLRNKRTIRLVNRGTGTVMAGAAVLVATRN